MNMNQFQSEVEPISIEGFQVVSGELFSRVSSCASPSCTIWSSGITLFPYQELRFTVLHHLGVRDNLQQAGAECAELL